MPLPIVIQVGGSTDKELTEGAGVVEVFESMGQTTMYRLRYGLSSLDGDIPFLADERIDPGQELAIFTEVAGAVFCLAKGPVVRQEIRMRHGGTDSSVDIIGGDRTIEMDREWKGVVWDDLTDSQAVESILGSYPLLEPDVEATNAVHAVAKHALVQRESDLRFVRRLARRNGSLFWVSYADDGTETAHFRRPQLDGEPAGELIINLEKNTLEYVEIEWDIERPSSTTAHEQDGLAKEKIDGSVLQSPLIPLGTTPFAGIGAGTRLAQLSAAVDDGGDLTARSEGALIEASFFVKAKCSTSATALRTVLRSHSVIVLRGMGNRHSGGYYCSSVRHWIDNDGHRMDFELIRNAWGAS